MNEIVKQFKEHGLSASYHYADDTGKEWHLARSKKEKAMKLYFNNPSLQDEMKEVSLKFLWSLGNELKYNNHLEAGREQPCHCADNQGGPCSSCMEQKHGL